MKGHEMTQEYKLHYPVIKVKSKSRARYFKCFIAILFLGILYGIYWMMQPRNCKFFGWRIIPNCGENWEVCGFENKDCKLRIDLYYEVLCPDSINFVINQLFPFAIKLRDEDENIQKLITFNMYAFGKAKEIGHGNSSNFKCQHGDDECKGNMWHACAWNHKFSTDHPDPMYFIGCTLSKNEFFGSLMECSTHANIDYYELKQCVEGPEGHAIMHQNAIHTFGLRPRLYYVPWILINGKYSDSVRQKAESNLLGLVCETLKKQNLKMCQKGTN